MSLMPKKTTFRKFRKIRISGKASSNVDVTFGKFGLKATSGGRVSAKHIETARRTITRTLKRTGKLWIKIFPQLPVTKKPAEVRMGNGKGSVEMWVSNVKPGNILFEVDGVDYDLAKEAFQKAGYKLPVDTKIVVRKFVNVS